MVQLQSAWSFPLSEQQSVDCVASLVGHYGCRVENAFEFAKKNGSYLHIDGASCVTEHIIQLLSFTPSRFSELDGAEKATTALGMCAEQASALGLHVVLARIVHVDSSLRRRCAWNALEAEKQRCFFTPV